MGITLVLVLVAIVLVVTAVVAILVLRRRRHPGAEPGAAAPTSGTARVPDLAPMTGLESALERVTDRTGRPIRERIDAEARHVDDLRVSDDTGPLLRRALDHVARPGPDTAADPPSEAASDDEAERDA